MKSLNVTIYTVPMLLFLWGMTSAQSVEPTAEPGTAKTTTKVITEEERQHWIEERLAFFEKFIVDTMAARDQLSAGIVEMGQQKEPLDRKEACKATDILMADHFKAVEKVMQMIKDIEPRQDRLNEDQRARLLTAKSKMSELMTKVNACK